jgi:hypothetical protein
MSDSARVGDASIRILSDCHVLSANPELCEHTPSRKHDISPNEEVAMRSYGCQLIQHACIQLQLSTSTCATAQIMFHRFYFRQSMRKCVCVLFRHAPFQAVDVLFRYSVERMAPACLYLAAKVEEQPQPISNILEVFHYMFCANLGKLHVSLLESPDTIVGEKRADLTKMESLLLTQLGFIIHTELPYKFLCAYLDFLGLSTRRDLAQRSWNYSNDVLRSDACVRYDAPTLACACIHLAAADLCVALPFDPPWWAVFNVSDESIACVTMILQQLMDMPRAFNVLEPPPSITAKTIPGKTEDNVYQLSEAIDSTFASAADGGLGRALHSKDASADDEKSNRRRCSTEHDGTVDRYDSSRVYHSDERSRASDNHRCNEHRRHYEERRSYTRDDGRHCDRDRRYDDRDNARDGYRSGRDDSRERRKDYARSSDGGAGRRDSSRTTHDFMRDDCREERICRDSDVSESSSEVLHRSNRHGTHATGSDNKAACHNDGVAMKAGRRSGRWDES